MKITAWYKFDENKKSYEFNHIEEGESDSNYPKPFHDSYLNQVAWKNAKWRKEFKQLLDGVVVENI